MFGFVTLALGITAISAPAQVTVRIGEATTVQARSVGITLDGMIEAEGGFDTRGSTITFTQQDGSGGINLGSGLGVELIDSGAFVGTTISGAVQIQGTLAITVTDDTEIQQGTTFTVLTCTDGCSGTFAQIDASYGFHVTYEENSVTVEALEDISTAIEGGRPSVDKLRLHAAYPNPFSGSTMLQLDVPSGGDVRVEVFDLLGRRVAIIAESSLTAGSHEIRWVPTGLGSGVYFVRARLNNEIGTVQRILLAR